MDHNATAATFTPSARGGYLTPFTFTRSGNTGRIRTVKSERMNPSVRGGAYISEWEAKFGNDKGRGKTRVEALHRLAHRMQSRGIHITFGQ
jgi:hypothetical protein